MARYSLRDGSIKAPKVSVKQLSLEATNKADGKFVAPYIKITPVAKGVSAQYLFIGTAGKLCIATSAPIGTSGAFANKGKILVSSAL